MSHRVECEAHAEDCGCLCICHRRCGALMPKAGTCHRRPGHVGQHQSEWDIKTRRERARRMAAA